MKLLITGGAGFIGSNFISLLLQNRPTWTLVNLDLLTYAASPKTIKKLSESPHYRLVQGDVAHAPLVDALLAANEPALRIVATLCGQIRGWLWVSLLDQQGESDVNAIAKAAGIGNPKRIYVLRRQLRGRGPDALLPLLEGMLEVERLLKLGARPADAFRDATDATIARPAKAASHARAARSILARRASRVARDSSNRASSRRKPSRLRARNRKRSPAASSAG